MAGNFSPSQGMPPEEAAYGFRKLADLIDLLKTHRLTLYRRQRCGPFSVTSGQGDITASSPITIGTGATWSTPRPVWIDGAGLIYTAGSVPYPELPMRVMTVKEWRAEQVKGITATLSYALIYDQTFTADGYGHIYLYPVPSASFQVVLYNGIPVAEFPLDANGNPDFTTAIALPPGYRMMLISNLAKIMCLGLQTISADLRETAENSLADVKTSNLVQHMDTLSCDSAVRQDGNRSGGWNWITGNIE